MFVYSPTKQSHTDGAAASKKHLRDHNTALIVRALWESTSGLSRADLSRLTGLSRATLSAISADLIEIGLLAEATHRSSRGGRPAIPLQFQPNHKHVIGVEMGSSHISAVRTDLRGAIQQRFHQELDVQNLPEEAVATIHRFVDRLTEEAPCPITGVGIGVPSPVEHHSTLRLSKHILPKWKNANLAAEISQRVQLPVMLDNDANLGALAEHWWGAGRGSRDLVYIKASTGIGAGLIIDGHIHRGAFGIAGEIGHTTVVDNGPPCRCGLHGCLESLIGTPALLKRARAQLNHPTLGLGELIRACNEGCSISQGIVRDTGRLLGEALANLIKTVNPGRIVLGGRISSAGSVLQDAIRDTLKQRMLSSWVSATEIHLSEVEHEPVAVGAATMLIQAALTDPRVLLQSTTREAPGALRPLPLQTANL